MLTSCLILLLAAVPAEHSIAPGWTAPQSANYQAGIDRQAAHSGHASVFIKAGTGDRQGGAVRQRIRAGGYRGKRIRLSGWIKTDHAAQGGALWLRIDMANGDYILDGMLELRGRDWSPVQIIAAVPADAVGITFGLRMVGAGQVWADDLNLEVVPPKTPTNTIERRKAPGANPAAEFLRAPLRPANLNFEQ